MNDDRCYHVPTSPGQTMCACLDYTVWLRFVIQTQAAYIADLERRMHTVAPRVIEPTIADERLHVARRVLVDTGYFTPDEVGDDVAPRIVELLTAIREGVA